METQIKQLQTNLRETNERQMKPIKSSLKKVKQEKMQIMHSLGVKEEMVDGLKFELRAKTKALDLDQKYNLIMEVLNKPDSEMDKDSKAKQIIYLLMTIKNVIPNEFNLRVKKSFN